MFLVFCLGKYMDLVPISRTMVSTLLKLPRKLDEAFNPLFSSIFYAMSRAIEFVFLSGAIIFLATAVFIDATPVIRISSLRDLCCKSSVTNKFVFIFMDNLL